MPVCLVHVPHPMRTSDTTAFSLAIASLNQDVPHYPLCLCPGTHDDSADANLAKGMAP